MIARTVIREELTKRGFDTTELAMQTQVTLNGRLLGGVNERHVYLVSGPVKTAELEGTVEVLGFEKRRQPTRFWWQSPEPALLYAALELLRLKLPKALAEIEAGSQDPFTTEQQPAA